MRKFLLFLLTWGIALIPTWLYLIVRFLLNPEGFWQEFFLLGLGLYVLGTIQLFMALAGLAVTYFVLQDE
jgi:hypothetical protein